MMMATCALLLMGCQKELDGVITATIEGYDGGGEKVYIDNQRYACWHDGDKVHVNDMEGVVEVQAGDNKAVIRGVDLSAISGTTVTAIYPYDNVHWGEYAEEYSITIPKNQYYREQEGPDGSKVQVLDAPMMAVAEKDEAGNVALNFKNMGSLVKVHVKACPDKIVRKIRVVSQSETYIAGSYTYEWNNGEVQLNKGVEVLMDQYVNLYIPKEFGRLDEDKDFYLSICGDDGFYVEPIPLTVEVVYEEVDENSFATNMLLSKTRSESVYVPRNSIVIGPMVDLGTMSGEKWFGEGSKDYPFLISTAKELDSLFGLYWQDNKYYKLVDDIDMTELPNFATTFEGYGTDNNPFYGTFDGNGKTIILGKKGSPSKSGLFNKYYDGDIKNLNMEVEIVSDRKSLGAIVNSVVFPVSDDASYSITNCKVMGNIRYIGIVEGTQAGYCIGGFVGVTPNTGKTIIENCVNGADIKSDSPLNSNGQIGGFCGSIPFVSIKNCINVGNITGGFRCGGIIGEISYGSPCTIDRCVNRGDIYANGRHREYYPYIGGIVGTISGQISMEIRNCVNHGKLDGVYQSDRENKASQIGGLVGRSDQSNVNIENCYSDGDCVGDGIVGNTNHYYSQNVAPTTTMIKNVYVGGTIGEVGRWIYGPRSRDKYAQISVDHVYRPNDDRVDDKITSQTCFEKYNVSNYQTTTTSGSVLSKLNSYRTGHPEWVAWSDGGGGKPVFAYELEGVSAGQFDDGGAWGWN